MVVTGGTQLKGCRPLPGSYSSKLCKSQQAIFPSLCTTGKAIFPPYLLLLFLVIEVSWNFSFKLAYGNSTSPQEQTAAIPITLVPCLLSNKESFCLHHFVNIHLAYVKSHRLSLAGIFIFYQKRIYVISWFSAHFFWGIKWAYNHTVA